uniref:Uncharacterized protein n=1 Tax=Panagrolaimus superbus TaxID=310955 RepID=A0A914XTC5_9BILA
METFLIFFFPLFYLLINLCRFEEDLSIIICDTISDKEVELTKLRLNESDEGKVFKVFVERTQWNNPCLINIPSRVFVYLFIKFHKPSIVTLTSGNSGSPIDFSHTGQTIIPKLNEATIYGPIYVPCEKSVLVFRSRGFGESLAFSFSYPSKDFIQIHPDPLSCNKEYQNPQLRRAVGYANAAWLSNGESNLHSMKNQLKSEWLEHRKTAFDPL